MVGKIRSKKGEMGMGTLIIFISMILVAAVAASVLINTVGTLQNQALDVGRATQEEIGTGLSVLNIYGEDGSDSTIERLTISTKLVAGSTNIHFDDVLLSFTLHNATQDYDFDDSINCSNSTDISSTSFGVEYSLTSTNHKSGYFQPGDIAKICFESPRELVESESLRISLIPQVGIPLRITTQIPRLVYTQQVSLYP